jgi:DNA polymerase-3 subunit alpha
MRDKDGGMITQWTERANAQLISPYGFLKIDCLATDGLTNQDRTIKLIKERHGIDIDFEDQEEFAFLTDPRAVEDDVIKAFVQGTNIGIFQFEGKGIGGLLKTIKPDNLEHIIAANALYRPGTLENKVAFEYAKRKNGARWNLPHESVKDIIGTTYGFMIYQEQVMQIYYALAKDATASEAATFMKVVAKGIARDIDGKKKLQEYRDKFIDGCIEKRIPRESYDELWEQILQMTTYAFNKSHSAGYAVQAYQDMFLKIKYPLEFYASLLSIEIDKIPEIIKESKKFGIKILPPDINISNDGFTIDGNSIRFGLLGIKNIGPSAAKELKDKRPFSSFEDILRKCEKAKVNKGIKNALISSGALDSFGARDMWLLDDDGETRISKTLNMSEKSTMEKEYIGFAVSRKDDVERFESIISQTIDDPESVDGDDGKEVCVGGEITSLKEITTKKSDKMAFATVSFKDHDFNLTIFPFEYAKYMRMLDQGTAILVLGKWDKERQTVIANNICTAEQLALEK